MGDFAADPAPDDPAGPPELQAARALASSAAPTMGPARERMVRLRGMVLNLLEADEE